MKTQVCIAMLSLATISGDVIAQEVSDSPLRQSLRDSFPESYAAIEETYDSSSVPELITILNSAEADNVRPQAAGVLGVVGNEQAVSVLIEVIERPIFGPVYISQTQNEVRKQAIRSLGLLAGRTGSVEAMDYLIESLDDNVWRRRNIQGVPSYLNTFEQYDRQLSIYAIFGLALSGDPRAKGALDSLRESPAPNQARLRAGLDETLDTWMEVHRLVAEKGAAGMFDHFETQRRIEAERQTEEARQIREASDR